MLFGLIIMVLVDVVMYVVIFGCFGVVEMVVILNLNINFFSKFRFEDLLVEVSIFKLGWCQVVCEVGVFLQSNEEDLVVYVIGIYVFFLQVCCC